MPYNSEGEGRRPRWKFWRTKSFETADSIAAAKQRSSPSDESYRGGPSRGPNDQASENASLPGHFTINGSDASSVRKESTASPSLNPRSLSSSSISPVEHTKSTSTTTSNPVVTRETHTDPVTGELTITITTTVVATTTTRRIIKIPPATPDEVDLDEERRLAAEYLASNGLQSPRDRAGLHPAPRRAGSHSNLISRAAEQQQQQQQHPFGPRAAAPDRSYSMGSRTGPPPSFSAARNFSRPGPNKQAGEEPQARLSLDARRGLKRAESMRSKSFFFRRPEQKPAAHDQPTVPKLEHKLNHSQSIDTISLQSTHIRPHTRDGGERWTGNQRHLTFHRPRLQFPMSSPVQEAELSPRRGSWGTFGGGVGMKREQQQQQQETNKFILGLPSTGRQFGNMF